MTSSPRKNLARSINQRLSNLATKRKEPFERILTEFLLERLAHRLVTDSRLGTSLIFKGGYVSVRVYQSPRYTTDLDALVRGQDLKSASTEARKAVEKTLDDGVWFRFQESIDLKIQNEYGGIRLIFRCGVGDPPQNVRRAQLVNFDIGTGDPVTLKEARHETPFLLSGGSLSWQVYPVETICAEKLHSLLTRRSDNSRAKDVFDLNLLLPQCEPDTLSRALGETFNYRRAAVPDDIAGSLRGVGTGLMKQGWSSAVTGIEGAGDFDTIFSQLVEKMDRMWSKKRK